MRIALPNLQATLTLDLEASPHNRQDLIELAADALLSYPSITQLEHSGLKPEEIATLTQRCINQEVGIAEQEGKMLLRKKSLIPLLAPILAPRCSQKNRMRE